MNQVLYKLYQSKWMRTYNYILPTFSNNVYGSTSQNDFVFRFLPVEQISWLKRNAFGFVSICQIKIIAYVRDRGLSQKTIFKANFYREKVFPDFVFGRKLHGIVSERPQIHYNFHENRLTR